ncbi:MAG: autotransporter outer membrane beta-barrel domain-containing protein, partial [Alphaproteobacteria bacterium]|nr:autotransporter outer membrane beta-barrel domain-containing protein [Alphaproteobacteria bacterium]
ILNGTNSYIKLGNEYVFSGNKATLGNDIYNLGGHIHFTNGVDEEGDLLVGTLDGGIYNRSGHILKNGSGILVLGDESINNYENKNSVVARFTQTSGLTIAGSHNLALAEAHTINGGELKTHGAEIGYKATLGETGTLTHLGTSADTPTEIKGVTFNGTGLNLTLGTYTKAEQEKEIALVGDRLVEYVDDKGTVDTADDELVSYQATDKLFTVKALENDQKAKFILKENLAGMDGNTLTIDNAELDVKEGLKVAGKVIAKDMRLPAEKTSSFTALEVAEKGLLDIQNQTVTADTLSLNQEGAVKVSVHSLSDYGQILATETVSEGAGTLTMNLVGAPEEGVYKVFESDTDLKLVTTHEFLDITDLENGSYKIARKKANELAEKFGLNEEETRAVSAVIGGNSENEAFQKVQTEIMETLKSGNKGKAKKALSAVGSKEHPVEQSVASEHLVALQNVVQAELHGSTVGHSGGDTDPRAKVYIKGLYDRTKSSMGEGFRARSKGAVLGVQSEVTEDLTLGVGYATSQTTAKEDLRRTEVDTNTGFISAHYQPNPWWVSGLATFSRGEYEEEKQILSSMGKASYDVDSWGAQVMTGYDIKLENAIITPEVGLRYLS